MDDAPEAKLLFLTRPERGTILLNMQLHGEDKLVQIKINRDQLFNLNSQSADNLLKEWK